MSYQQAWGLRGAAGETGHVMRALSPLRDSSILHGLPTTRLAPAATPVRSKEPAGAQGIVEVSSVSLGGGQERQTSKLLAVTPTP